MYAWIQLTRASDTVLELAIDIAEHTAADTFLGRVALLPPDAAPNMATSFLLNSTESGGAFFAVDTSAERSGWVTTTVRPTDRELSAEHTFAIYAVGDGAHTISVRERLQVTVTVTDINDQTPTFSQQVYRSQIVESTADTELVTVVASDGDLAGQPQSTVTYAIVSDAREFTVDPLSGVFAIGEALDFERAADRTSTVTVRASDAGVPSRFSDCTVVVTLVDENDNPPAFVRTDIALEFLEHSVEIGYQLLPLSFHVVDADSAYNNNNVVIYEFVSGNDLGHFELGRLSGTIINTVDFDHEALGTYSLVFRVFNLKDGEEFISSTDSRLTVNVTIVDVDEHGPVFPDAFTQFYIEHNAPAGRALAYALAVDADSFPFNILQYALQGPDAGSFTINASTGALATAPLENRPSQARYTITVVATSHGTATST